MIKLEWNKRYVRRLKKYLQKHPEKYDKIKKRLKKFQENPHALELRMHNLSGRLKGLKAIDIEYDCRIVLEFNEKENNALLVDIGTHEEVY